MFSTGMSIFDSIEKLITEHGSASILRERLAQAKDQHAILEGKASALERENTQLKSDCERLKLDLDKALADIAARYSALPSNVAPMKRAPPSP